MYNDTKHTEKIKWKKLLSDLALSLILFRNFWPKENNIFERVFWTRQQYELENATSQNEPHTNYIRPR